MKKMSLSVKNQSIETSGLTKDYKEALCEYIWNGFEAGATKISIAFSENGFGGIQDITITDNGSGINYYDLSETFGSFLVSQKNSLSLHLKSKVNKGKGRFSFGIFSSLAEWHTVFNDNGQHRKYHIVLANEDKQEFDYSEPTSTDEPLGTTVVFHNISQLHPEDMAISALSDCLMSQFAWFLYLNQHKGLELFLGQHKLDYRQHINEALSVRHTFSINNESFDIDLIVWNKRIHEKYSCYLMDSVGMVRNIDTTTFNRNTVGFSHSVFVTSSYFDKCTNVSLDDSDQLHAENPADYASVARALRKEIQQLISRQLCLYMSGKADEVIQKMIEERHTFPTFPDDEYGELRKKDLIRVTKEIYCAEPRIFHKLSDLQEKSLLAFLNLLLVSGERENVLGIIEQIVNLSAEQRSTFAELLKRTKLENIVETIQFIDSRYKVIEILKKLVYDLTAFTNERDHIQKIVEKHFWLFGEKYHLASADVTMKKALSEYLNILYGSDAPEVALTPDEEENRRMDIFLCQSRRAENNGGSLVEENIVVELKAPKVPLTVKVLRQIEDYVRYIHKQPQFASVKRKWKFFAVCSVVDEEVKIRYKTFENQNKPGLVEVYDNFEIYAFSWDDIFTDFDLRHSFLLEKLKVNRDALIEELSNYTPSRNTANVLTQQITNT